MNALASCRAVRRSSPCGVEGLEQVPGLELDVVEHLGHRVAVHHVGDLGTLLGHLDVDRIGVAEQVVEVAQDRVGAGEEDAQM